MHIPQDATCPIVDPKQSRTTHADVRIRQIALRHPLPTVDIDWHEGFYSREQVGTAQGATPPVHRKEVAGRPAFGSDRHELGLGLDEKALARRRVNNVLFFVSEELIARKCRSRTCRESVVVTNHDSAGAKERIEVSKRIECGLMQVDIKVNKSEFGSLGDY